MERNARCDGPAQHLKVVEIDPEARLRGGFEDLEGGKRRSVDDEVEDGSAADFEVEFAEGREGVRVRVLDRDGRLGVPVGEACPNTMKDGEIELRLIHQVWAVIPERFIRLIHVILDVDSVLVEHVSLNS